MASKRDRYEIFKLVLGVIGCDDSEITRLAVDLSPMIGVHIMLWENLE